MIDFVLDKKTIEQNADHILTELRANPDSEIDGINFTRRYLKALKWAL